jgi:hypothetical protein
MDLHFRISLCGFPTRADLDLAISFITLSFWGRSGRAPPRGPCRCLPIMVFYMKPYALPVPDCLP